MSRRRFLALSAAGASAAALAACGSSGSSSSSALQIASPDKPVTLKVSSSNKAIASGSKAESGNLRIANYADYIAPELLDSFKKLTGASVEVSVFATDTEALSKIASGAFNVDLLLSTAVDTLPKFVASNLVQPLQKSYLTNYDNLWASVRDPFYDKGAQYTVPYTVFSTGVGFRTDMVATQLTGDTGWDALWDPRYSGAVGLLDSYREAIGLGLQHVGIENVNTESATDLAAAKAEIKRMLKATNPRIDVLGYQNIPEGTTKVNQCWSGDMLTALNDLPDGTSADVIGYWCAPIAKRVINNDTMSIMRKASHPVLAHQFINFMLDPANAAINQAYIGYQSTLKGFEADTLIADGTIPKNLANALVTEDDFAKGLRITALPLAADKLWQDTWSELNTGS
ncbi:MAG TPA: spermidine/putrescine ABC transporter substrate-binding protein [Ilumatobacteraceae bacterium]